MIHAMGRQRDVAEIGVATGLSGIRGSGVKLHLRMRRGKGIGVRAGVRSWEKVEGTIQQ